MITMSLNRTNIGENAKKARESNGFSQASVAVFLGVDQSLISKFEKGERTIQSEMLERLANLYGYTVADFVRDGGIPEQQLKAAYRSSGLTPDDMEVIHDIRRIAINLFFMTDLIGGDSVEK
jgi:transcriptional regulator with XRE-family HTH domain